MKTCCTQCTICMIVITIFFASKRHWSFPLGPGTHVFLQWNKCDCQHFKTNTYLGLLIHWSLKKVMLCEQWIWKIRDIYEMEKITYSLRLQMNIFEARRSPILKIIAHCLYIVSWIIYMFTKHIDFLFTHVLILKILKLWKTLWFLFVFGFSPFLYFCKSFQIYAPLLTISDA